jgi:hypothetical protein
MSCPTKQVKLRVRCNKLIVTMIRKLLKESDKTIMATDRKPELVDALVSLVIERNKGLVL